MKTFIRTTGLFILALSIGILLAPRAGSIAQLTASALRNQIHALAGQIQGSLDAAAPEVAVHIATVLIGLGAVGLTLFLYLLVFMPLRIHSMQREMRRQREQLQSMMSEVHLSSELLLDARRDYQAQGETPVQRETAPSRLHQWTVPRGAGQPAKGATHP
ncbi:MAG TPA: hypothetical protein VG028_02470 [Terriglobia bacterium]|nr:hypothetical protein [Terriglobia bacterium]